MAIKAKEQAIIDLVINGQQAQSSLRELSGAYNALLANVSALRRADNPALYEQQVAALNRVRAAREAERQSVLGQTEANKGFFADFKKGFSEIEELAGKITAGTLIYKGVSGIIEGIRGLFEGTQEAYDEAQRSQTQLQAALKSTGGVAGETQKQLKEYQETLMNQTGVDDAVIAKGEELLLTFTNVRGKIYEQALPAIVDMTAALNGGKVSMEGIQATTIQVGKALNDPITGMTALKKVGVTLDDQQKEQIKTLYKSNDVMGAQTIILKELNKEFGGTAKAISDTDVGKLQRFDTAIRILKEGIGEFIIDGKAIFADFFTPLIERLNGSTTAAKQLADEFYKQKDAVSGLEKNTQPLINRYDELKEKGSLNKVEQIELNSIINTLASTIPTAVTQWDKYGNALGINTDKARDFIKMQQAMLKIKNKDAIDESQSTIDALEAKAGRIQGILSYGKKTIIGGRNGSDGAVPETSLTAGDISGYSDELKKIKEQVDDLKLGVRGLKGDAIDIPSETKVTPPTGGPTAAELEAARKKAEAYAKQVQDLRDEYLKLSEGAQKGTVDDLDAQLAVIDAKYNKIVAKLQKLSSDPKLTKEFKDKINSINGPGGLRAGEKNAAFTKVNSDGIATQFKKATGDIDDTFSNAQGDLDNSMNADLKGVNDKDPAIVEARRLDIQQTYAQKRFELEQKHLEAMKDIYSAYGVSTASLDKKIADNTIKENDRAAKEKEAKDKLYASKKVEIQQLEMSTLQQGTQFLESILDKRSALYAAAFIIDKAVAIAGVVISTNLAIAKFAASVAELGPLGVPLLTAYAINAHIQEGISIASIAAQSIGQLAGGNSSNKKAAKGGTFEGAGHDQGGLNVVDPRTGETVVNVEGGEPWMVLSRETKRNNGALINQLLFNSMFRNGARVDVAGVTSGIQVARSGGVFNAQAQSTIPTPGQPLAPAGVDLEARISQIEAHLQSTAALLEKEVSRPVSLNYQYFKRETDKNVVISNNANG